MRASRTAETLRPALSATTVSGRVPSIAASTPDQKFSARFCDWNGGIPFRRLAALTCSALRPITSATWPSVAVPSKAASSSLQGLCACLDFGIPLFFSLASITAFGVRPISAASALSGMVPSIASSSACHLLRFSGPLFALLTETVRARTARRCLRAPYRRNHPASRC